MGNVVCGRGYCGDVQQCAEVCLAVEVAVYGSVWQCAAVRQCVAGVRTAVCARCARYGVLAVRLAVFGSARSRVQQCAAVRAAVNIQQQCAR